MIACDNKKQEIGGAFIMHKFKVVLLVKRIAQNTCTTNALYKYVVINNHKYIRKTISFQKHLGMYILKNDNIYRAYFKPQIGYIYQN